MSHDDWKVVDFPKAEVAPEERARRLKVEVERLASLPPVEWLFYLNTDGVAEKHGIERAGLKAMIETTIKAREKRAREDKAEDRRRKQRVEKQKVATKRERESTQEKQEKEAERKAKAREKEKATAFKELARLPSKEQDLRLVKLAKRLGEDLETIRAEFEVFAGGSGKRDSSYIELWPEPVDTGELLSELTEHLQRYIILDPDAVLAVSLWVMFSWVQEIAVHSPILIVTFAERDSGKTTLLGVLGFLTPRPYSVVEMTGPGLFHIVDHMHPTLIVDEADKLFHRKPDLLHIANAGWTRGTKIPRMTHGVIHEFDPFCPKVIGMKGFTLPDTLASRGIVVKLWPKTDDEKVSDFTFSDDVDFEALRRKLARWSADSAVKIKDANPALPLGFGNRLAANWRLLLTIAELADCTEQAHHAAIALSRKLRRPSEGVRLLAALRPMFAKREMLSSEDVVTQLVADQDAEWCEFRGRGPITKRQVALILDQYDIHPDVIHPKSNLSQRGYRAPQFETAFARFLPPMRTSVRKPRRRPRKRGASVRLFTRRG